MSTRLKFGVVHPRTLLELVRNSGFSDSEGARRFVAEICWREFYADVLFHNPASVRANLVQGVDVDCDDGPEADALFEAWRTGNTGYPFVDAGMRQLLHDGWMHNRLRMVTASFLVKDLHLPWQRGAEWFMQALYDADIASNQHGWQWTAGTGTDASPYFRVFNPVGQGKRFDPEGEYIRRWVPELAQLSTAHVHEPWLAPSNRGAQRLDFGSAAEATGDAARRYPPPVVDHAAERLEALERYGRRS